MRPITCMLTLAVLGLPSYAQGSPAPCEGKTLAYCIENAMHDTAIDFDAYRVPASFQRGLVDTRAIRHASWFKPLVITYWVAAAIDSYLDDDEFRLRENMYRERTVSASYNFGINGSRRAVFDPRRSMVFFPIGKDKHTNHLWAVHVTSSGAAISLAIDLDRLTGRIN